MIFCSSVFACTLPNISTVFKTRSCPNEKEVVNWFFRKFETALADGVMYCFAPDDLGTATCRYPQSMRRSSPFFCKTGCSFVPTFKMERSPYSYFFADTSCDAVLTLILLDAPTCT